MTLVEILIAMVLLAGLVVPLVLTGLRFASATFARERLMRQQEPAKNHVLAATVADSIQVGVIPNLGDHWRCDTLSGEARDYVIIRSTQKEDMNPVLRPITKTP